MLKEEVRTQSGVCKEEEPLDELVLMSTNQMAGPPVTDIPFGDGVDNMDSSGLFATTESGLDDATDHGFLSLLTGEMNHLQDHLAANPLVLDASPQPNGDLGVSQQVGGTISSSNLMLSPLKEDCPSTFPPPSIQDARHPVDGIHIDHTFLGELDQIAAQEFTRISSSAASSAGAPSKKGSKKKNVAPAERALTGIGIGISMRNSEKKGNAASTVRSGAPSSRGTEKSDAGSLSMLDDDKENESGQKPTRLRYSKGAAPSKYCHVCGRSAKTVSVALCGNNKLGLCRKVVCDKCLIMHQWGDFRSAKESESSWICTHCRGDCPARARCHQYQRNNMRRRLKSTANANQRANSMAGLGGMPRGIAGGAVISKQIPGTVSLHRGGKGAASVRPVVTSIPQIPGLGKLIPDGAGKTPGAIPDLTPTNIMGAANALVDGTISRPPAGIPLNGSCLYSSFNVLE